MAISLVVAALIGRVIRSMPNVPLGARPGLPLPRVPVLVPAAFGGALAALAVFALAAPSLHPGLTRPGVANGLLLPGPPTPRSLAADGARDRPRSASPQAGPVLASAAIALQSPGLVAPAGAALPTSRPGPGPSGRKRGGGSSGAISLPANDQPSAPTPPAQPPAVSQPITPAPTPAPAGAQQVDPGSQTAEVPSRRVGLPSDGSPTASAPSVPAGGGGTGQLGQGGGDGDE
jgi:hypothetical protein